MLQHYTCTGLQEFTLALAIDDLTLKNLCSQALADIAITRTELFQLLVLTFLARVREQFRKVSHPPIYVLNYCVQTPHDQRLSRRIQLLDVDDADTDNNWFCCSLEYELYPNQKLRRTFKFI